MKKPKTLIITAPLINCEHETYNALKYLGASPTLAHIDAVLRKEEKINNYDILVFPGGFSYGDDIAGGTILANKIKKLLPDIFKFNRDKKLIIGICNGCQVLMKANIIPFTGAKKPAVSLTVNDCGHYVDKWVEMKVNKKSPCIFTKNLPEIIELPVAHGEGKFVVDSGKTLKKLINQNLIALTYIDNPNGSVYGIAGLCNSQGNIFGLMPHPERYVLKKHHPFWSAKKSKIIFGLEILKNAVRYTK